MNLNEVLKKLRDGEQVICPICNKGIMKPINNADYKIAHGFQCGSCGETMNID